MMGRPAVSLVLGVALVGGSCAGDDGAAPTTATEVVAPPSPATTAADTEGAGRSVPESTTSDDAGPVEVHEAVAVDHIDLGGEWVGLRSDGRYLWAAGEPGEIARIDPSTAEVRTAVVAPGAGDTLLLSTGPDAGGWWVADARSINGTYLARIDPDTLDVVVDGDGPVGYVLGGIPDEPGVVWVEQSDPARLRRLDAATLEVGGPAIVPPGEGESVGAIAAAGSLWVPRFDSNEIVQFDPTGALVDRFPTGVGPADLVELGGDIWWSNRIDGTVGHLDQTTHDVRVVDLNAQVGAVERVGGVVTTTDAVWAIVRRIDDGIGVVMRIDPAASTVVAVRALPGSLQSEEVSGAAAIGDRLFVIDRTAGELVELDTEEFLDAPTGPAVGSSTWSPEQAEVVAALDELLSSDSPMAERTTALEDGHEHAAELADFLSFFEQNAPGEQFGPKALDVRIVGDRATVTYVMELSGFPVIDAQSATLLRTDRGWLVDSESFCSLVALGDVECR